MPIILATWEAEIWRIISFRSAWAKKKKTKKTQGMDRR
jgi:hypothetical protein